MKIKQLCICTAVVMLITSTAMASKNTETTNDISIADGHKLIARAASLSVSEEVMPFHFAAVAKTSINAINIIKAEEEAKKKKAAEEKAAKEKAEAEARAKAEAEAQAAAEAAAAEEAARAQALAVEEQSEPDNDTTPEKKPAKASGSSSGKTTGVLTREKGVNYFNGVKETYYSQRVLPGGGLNIPGRHVAGDGTIRDKDNYIVVASSNLRKGTTGECSLGPFKVYDSGVGHSGIDIYTDW